MLPSCGCFRYPLLRGVSRCH